MDSSVAMKSRNRSEITYYLTTVAISLQGGIKKKVPLRIQFKKLLNLLENYLIQNFSITITKYLQIINYLVSNYT